ncbi:predicted protein [Chaetomium globosum CBS 148.51]|uniref:Uncharacterized protein n=1 Tax=Chaetomium globosum (strain ATCC 6205 / CBS 148.51 / DSM 1962 / NBRC 6347 / NRRL 1970) TaxID=306901 RepID=Q2GML1_CHAGB|nr:uncharacterized protein CHGG_10793 [Chaetomium globosum CBS 148.51]EAQ82975.1 predicted protein [Chaetomium globosum CBS 148.51]
MERDLSDELRPLTRGKENRVLTMLQGDAYGEHGAMPGHTRAQSLEEDVEDRRSKTILDAPESFHVGQLSQQIAYLMPVLPKVFARQQQSRPYLVAGDHAPYCRVDGLIVGGL